MAKLKNRPNMLLIDKKVKRVWTTRSQSRPHIMHLTIELEEPLMTPTAALRYIFCSCDGFSTHGHCWHTDEAVLEHGATE